VNKFNPNDALTDQRPIINPDLDLGHLMTNRRLFDISQDFLITLTLTGAIADVNQAFIKATGYPKKDLIDSNLFQYMEDFEQAETCFRHVLQHGTVTNYLCGIKRADASILPVIFNATGLTDANDSVIGVFAEARDVTETQIKEKELRYLKDNLEHLIKARTDELETTKMLLKSSLESPQDMIILCIDQHYRYLFFNQTHKAAMKYAYGKDVVEGQNIMDQITTPSDREKSKRNYDLALAGTSHTTIEQYGDIVVSYYETFYNPVYNDQHEIVGATAFARNITDRIVAETQLRQQNNLTAALLKILPVGVFMVDSKTGKPLIANEAAQHMLGRGILPDANKHNLSHVYKAHKPGKTEAYPANEMPIVLGMHGKESHIDDMVVERPDGTQSLLEIYGTPLVDEKGSTWASLVTFMDITERRQYEQNLIYVGFHDQLTGLYNRRFFEEELLRLNTKRNYPLSIVMGDVNGLKLVNDSFGHAMGDELLIKVSSALKEGIRSDDIVARYGGDEFIMILPKTSLEEAEKIVRRFKYLISLQQSDLLDISVSFGVETLIDDSESIQDIIKKTEDDMYQHKVYESSSMRSKTIDLIMKTLFEKNSREMLHSKRVSGICAAIAKKMKLNKDEVKKIRLTGLMHDIGKIGINEKILNSSETLNEDEVSEIRKHCEIGSRILGASNEFAEIAEVVLQHHERWDGKGYPQGLKGEDISLHARIIAVADTYDAMVSDRAYRKSFSVPQALQEIKRCSGTQFDPQVVKVFTQLINEEITSLYLD